MKLNLWTAFLSVILTCFGQADAYSVYLEPSPTVEVKEGDTLRLCCICHGFSNPDYINWYLNNDTFGLEIDTSSCKYQTRLGLYEIDRYNISCYETKFYLTIAKISKDKDDQDTWKCDATVIGSPSLQKASTRIVVKGAGPADPKKGQIDEPMTEVTKSGQIDERNTVVTVVVPVVVVGVIAISITVAGCNIYRKRRNDHHKNKTNKDDSENPVKDRDEDPDNYPVAENDEDGDKDIERMEIVGKFIFEKRLIAAV